MPISSLNEFYQPRMFLLIGLIILLFIFGVIFLFKSIKKEQAERRIFICYGIFEILYGFTRLFFLFSDYYIAINFGFETPIHLFFVTVAYSMTTASLILIFYILEKYLVHTKFIFTGISTTIFIFSVLSIFEIISQKVSQMIIYILAPALIVCILSLYLYVIRTTEGSTKQKAIGIFWGIFFLTVGLILDARFVEYLTPGLLNQIRLILSPSFMILGIIIFNWSQLKQ